MEESNFLWEHFKLHADQRIKAFNFFVILSIFADGGVFTAIAKSFPPYLLIVLGFFIIVLSGIFWILDIRSHNLVKLSYKGLKKYESSLAIESRLFTLDSRRKKGIFSYTKAFALLFSLQTAFGLFVMTLGLVKALC